MTDTFVINYINDKLAQSKNEDFIGYTFYELKIKNNLNDEEIGRFLEINKDYFENKGYLVFFTGAKYSYKGANTVVQDNEMMIAIKEN